ncbi:MAG TPA: phosphatase PAP2-related protein [Polyangiaceae bacterium]
MKPNPGEPFVWDDPAGVLPPRLPLRVWVLASLAFVAVYLLMWSVVHVHVDVRPCLLRLPDPLFAVIPHDRRWDLITHDLYEVLTVGSVAVLIYQAVRGDHRGLVRFGAGLAVQAMLRCATLMLLPLCRANLTAGTVALKRVPTLQLGPIELPWRVWATNDLVFSGHVGEFLLLYWATRNWHPAVRMGLIVFQVLQAYALIATRGHYTVDILLALPCAYFANGVVTWCLVRLTGVPRVSTLAGFDSVTHRQLTR